MTEPSLSAPAAARYPCPTCLAPADLAAGCSGCGRPPDPTAAEVLRAAERIAELEREEQHRWRGLAEVRQQLGAERARRDSLAATVRAARAATVPPPPVPPPPDPPSPVAPLSAGRPPGLAAPAGPPRVPPPAPLPPPAPAVGRPEIASRSVQTLLFVAGGWLLGIGAIVFVVVGWSRYGLLGQAATLAGATAIGLAAPAVARWRQLPGTAETMAVIGMLVLLLDGYAVWQAGLVSGVSGWTWAGAVLAGTAVVALGYARLSGIVSLRYVALVLFQGAVPLLAVTTVAGLPGPTGWALGTAALALLLAVANLLVVARLRRAPTPRPAAQEALTGLGWIGVGGWLVASAGLAALLLIAPAVDTAVLATLLLVGSVVVLIGTARVAGRTEWGMVVAAAAVLVPGLAGARLVAVVVPEVAQLAAVTVVVVVAVGLAIERGWLARTIGPWRGRWVGALIALGLLGQALLGQALGVLGSAAPAFRAANDPTQATLPGAGSEYLWQLPASVVLVAAGAGWLLRSWPLVRQWVAAAALAVAVAAAAPQLLAVLVGPYSWLWHGWAGSPSGTGLFAGGGSLSSGPASLGMALLAAAAVLGGRAVLGQWRLGGAVGALVGGWALLLTLDWAQAPWPTLPAVSLAGGAALLVAAARWRSPGWTLAGLGYGAVLTGAGLAGMTPAAWSTVAALGGLVAVALLVAIGGRREGIRLAGGAAAAASGAALVVAVSRAVELPWPAAGLAVLVVAGITLAASTVRAPGSPAAVVGEIAAHTTALAALLLAVSAAPTVAVVAALWGVALGLRALRPAGSSAQPLGGRVARAVAAAGCQLFAWWVLVVYWQVTTVEAYTVPVAAIALLLGYLARRARSAGAARLGSWLAYGPALAAAALPSLAATLIDPSPLRRLLLGLAAVVVLLAGVRWRLQAPVVVGVTVAILAALRELALVWQRVDAWVPLTVAGTLLLLLAATYERRRRDLARAAAALRRLG